MLDREDIHVFTVAERAKPEDVWHRFHLPSLGLHTLHLGSHGWNDVNGTDSRQSMGTVNSEMETSE